MSERFPEAVTLAGMQKDNRLDLKQPTALQKFSWADKLPKPGQIRFQPP